MPDNSFLGGVDARRGRWRDAALEARGVSSQYFWTERGRDPLEVAYATAARRPSASIPRAEIHPDGGGMSSDGVHPNDNGYGVIAAGLRELGYEPLGPS